MFKLLFPAKWQGFCKIIDVALVQQKSEPLPACKSPYFLTPNSYIKMAAAIPALSDSALPGIGMVMFCVVNSLTSCRRPLASLPMTIAVLAPLLLVIQLCLL